ncbi:MAG: hypothetical protein WKG03_06090 [Telluria sp.]
MSPSLTSTFDVLDKLRRRPPTGRVGLELKAHRVTVYCLLMSMGFMALMLVLAAWHAFVVRLAPVGIQVALTFGVAASLLGGLSMVSITVEMCASIVEIIKNRSREFMQEVDWDLSQAAMLDRLSKTDLMRAREFLELKSARVHERIKMFIGGPDKIALLAIFGLLWLLYKELPTISILSMGAVHSWHDFTQLAIWAVVAFSIGIVAGAVASSYRLRHYTYQIEVIKLHLSTRA